MRQAITTKYHGPTNTRGSKVIATSASGHRLSLGWDYALNSDENHRAAALALATKLNWSGRWVAGATKDGVCFVNDDGSAFEIFRNI